MTPTSTSRALLRHTLESFKERFGDLPLRVFRAPGRVNLRGMHVDTHGGFLNLMTHQREVLLVAAASGTTTSILANVNPDFSEVVFDLAEEQRSVDFNRDWADAIATPEIAERTRTRRAYAETAWSNYCIGAALRIAHAHQQPALGGLKMMVHSDLPRGAALSSSAALIVAALLAYERCNGLESSVVTLIRATQDVEWYAGARVGMSDQTAILLGKPGRLLSIAVSAQDFSLDSARHIPFPDALDLLVVNSHTRRALSGAQRLAYSRNRFAYSMALTVLRAELKNTGMPSEQVKELDRLSRITPDALGGSANLYRILQRIPLCIDIETLRQRYNPPDLDGEYERYFGELDKEMQPENFPLRGLLLFGIAESERARLFPELLQAGEYEQAGRLMAIGHEGDRVHTTTNISDAMLERLAQENAPATLQPGVYGASSPALDMLVDAALEAGALGACLTGAGIAGAILVLCRKEKSAAISQSLAQTLQQESYARCANLSAPLDAATAAESVVCNQPADGAGELMLDAAGNIP